MKKEVFVFLATGALFFSSCEKSENKIDTFKIPGKEMDCDRCGGGWDLEGSDSGTTAARLVSTDSTSSSSAPAKAIPGKKPLNPGKPLKPVKP